MNYDPVHDVFLEPGSPITAQWCDECQDTCAVRVPLVGVSPLGAHVRSAIYLCPVCDTLLTVRQN